MRAKIFVDGQEGTTGLQIHAHLGARADLEVLKIDPELRKEVAERKRLFDAADIVFLCLPDGASREAVGLVENPRTRVIDASTAFRTDPAWAYGLPELERGGGQRERIRNAKRVAVPGCHATAFILGVRPLVAAGLLPAEAVLTCFSLTGYSGGGKKMIAQYEAARRPEKLAAPRHYALKLGHKHLPEMRVMAGLGHSPLFTPVVCDVYSGLAVETFLPAGILRKQAGLKDVWEALAEAYDGERFVRVLPWESEGHLDEGYFDITACNGTNRADIVVVGNQEQVAVMTRLDNLGKGASGAAVQNMNIMLGCEEGAGLLVGDCG